MQRVSHGCSAVMGRAVAARHVCGRRDPRNSRAAFETGRRRQALGGRSGKARERTAGVGKPGWPPVPHPDGRLGWRSGYWERLDVNDSD